MVPVGVISKELSEQTLTVMSFTIKSGSVCAVVVPQRKHSNAVTMKIFGKIVSFEFIFFVFYVVVLWNYVQFSLCLTFLYIKFKNNKKK